MNARDTARGSEAIIPAGGRIRVLVVDDSVVMRRLATQALEEDPQIEVVGTAANGSIALQRIPQVSPDLVTLDIEMPEMDGLETLRRLRAEHPKIRVIMLSTVTERGAAVTIEALSLGASDYVTKAPGAGSLDASLRRLRDDLVPKIKQFFHFARSSAGSARTGAGGAAGGAAGAAAAMGAKLAVGPVSLSKPARRRIVAMGVSTGGPQALSALFAALPADVKVPIVLVQHMPPLFTRLLAERLQSQGKLPVREARGGEELCAGVAYVAPGDYHLVVKREGKRVVTALHQEPPENSCRPSVDVLFRSVAELFGGDAVCVILTGMGQDGLRGTEILKSHGAYVIAQDEASSVVWGMPGFVVKAGLADEVSPLDQVAPRLLRQLG